MKGPGEGFLAGTGLAQQHRRDISIDDLQRALDVSADAAVAQGEVTEAAQLGGVVDVGALGYGDPALQLGLTTAARRRPQRREDALAGALQAQRERLAGSGVGRSQNVVGGAFEQVVHEHRRMPVAGQQLEVGTAVAADQLPLVVERDDVVGLYAQVLGEMATLQHPVGPQAVVGEGVLDLLGALDHHTEDQQLAVALVRRIQGGRVEQRDRLAVEAEDRRRTAGELDVVGAEVLVAMDQRGLTVDQTGADTAGAFLFLRPAGADAKAFFLEFPVLPRHGAEIDGHAGGVGHQHAVVGRQHLCIETVDALTRDPHEGFEPVPVLAQLLGGDDPWHVDLRRIHLVIVERALP